MNSSSLRLDAIDDLLSKLTLSNLGAALHDAGAAPCAALLAVAIRHQRARNWRGCHEAALKAREYAWERLHRSAPSHPV